MGFMDKVKAQADVLAQKAQEGAKAGQDKLSALQAKRQADSMLEELGGIIYCQRAGRSGVPGEDRVEDLIAQLQAYEAEHGPITPAAADAPTNPAGSGPPAAAPGGGGFIPSSGG